MWSDLPPEILDEVLRRLTFPDTRRFAAVCRRWCSVFASAMPRPWFSPDPWLLVSEPAEGASLPRRARRIGGSVRRLFSPAERRYYDVESPDFAGSVCHVAAGDWLLLSRAPAEKVEDRWEVLFLNPFSKARIGVCGLYSPFDLGVCSAVPTGADCLLLLITKGVTQLLTTVVKVQQQESQDCVNSYTHQTTFELDILDAVYCKGLFYMYGMSWMGRVLSFNPTNGSLQHIINMFSALSQPLSINLVQSNGNILVVTRGDSAGGWCRVYSLNISAKAFTQASEELDGQILLVGAGTSMSIPAATSQAPAGTIYFAKYGTFEGGMCQFKRESKSNIEALSPLDGGLYGLPGKYVCQWPMSLSDDTLFADNLERLHYIRVPKVQTFMDSSGEWYATGGVVGIWIQPPLC